MDGRQGSKEKLERGRRLGRGVWVWYLTTGAVLAISRVALLVWLNYRHPPGSWSWLYPEAVLSIFWRSLTGFVDWTEYYLAWGSLVTLGSFVMATPILLVGWLVRRRRQNLARS
jgi:hypothetical protein